MSKYVLSKRADEDLKQVVLRSLVDFGEIQTEQYIAGLEELLQLLVDNPEIGNAFIHEKTGRTYLRHRYMSHSLYYRRREDGIFVVRILHTKMLPKKHL